MEIRIITKPWSNREDGRILVMKGFKIVFSKHYRNLKHRSLIIKDILDTVELMK